MKNHSFFILILLLSINLSAQNAEKEITQVLDNWHNAAAEANFETYFSLMTDDAIFIGTDPTENWNKKEFKSFSKPYFDKGKAWSFTSLERNVFIKNKIAWFDELLQTQMGLCRGSGVLEKTTKGWRIQHYVLSISIPNEHVSKVTTLKKNFEEKFIKTLP